MSPQLKAAAPLLHLCLAVFLAASLAACETPAKSGKGPSSPGPVAEDLTLQAGEKELLLAANGKPLQTVILAVGDIIEQRAAQGKETEIELLQSALDRALEINCGESSDAKCEIKEREPNA